jgi:hypothetical protein
MPKNQMARGLPLALIVCLVMSMIVSCSDSTATEEYSGIYETRADGSFVGGDTTDWTFGDPLSSRYTFGPVAPNPTTASTMLTFSIAQKTQCKVYLKKRGGAIVSTILVGEFVAGIHSVEIEHPGTPGIYRVTFESSLGKSHGDIEFK